MLQKTQKSDIMCLSIDFYKGGRQVFFDFLKPLFELFYNETSILGEVFIKASKKAGTLLLRFVGKPLLFLLDTFLALGKHIIRWFIRSPMKWRLLSTKRAVSVDRMAQSRRSEPFGVARAAYFVPATRS